MEPESKKFMTKRLKQLVLDQANESIEVRNANFAAAFDLWKGQIEQTDDMTLIHVII